MENIAIFRINYKSDFILTLQSDAGWMTPFCIKFWTGAPSQAYFAGYDGTTYTHCAPVAGDPTKLMVQFDDHHLPIGDLKFQIGYHFTVADFPTSIEDEVINQAAVIIDNDGEQQQVMLDFNGETAPEIEFSLPAYANEAQRIANESQRIANEEQRIATETQRIANEEQRISQEQTRQQNEVQRIVQEQARVTAERERFNDYAKLKVDAIAATDAANSAADLANEKAQLAADNAQLAADKAALAQSASALATEKAQLATDKAALAQSAATLANEKAALAQQKAEYATAQGDYAKAQGDYAKAQAGVIPTDVTRTQTDATFVNGNHDPLFYLRQASSSLAGLMTAAGYTKLNDMPSAQEVNAGLAYDVSVLHPTSGVNGGSTYASLSAALAVIPQDKRKGGMTVKFVHSSDNKYIQYFLTKDEWSASEADWEKMNLGKVVDEIDNILLGESSYAISLGQHRNGTINLSATVGWENRSMAGHYLVPISRDGVYKVTTSSGDYKYIFLKEEPTYSNSGIRPETYPQLANGQSALSYLNSGDNIITAPYDAKYLYIQVTGSMADPSVYYLRSLVHNVAETLKTGDMPYYGDIQLSRPTCKIDTIGNVVGGGHQGGCVYGNLLFVCMGTGSVNVYNLLQNCAIAYAMTPTATFQLGMQLHGNSVFFGKKYDDADPFPILYVNSYNDNIQKGSLYGFRISVSGSTYTCTLVQTVHIGFVNSSIWTDGASDTRTYGNFILDTERDILYAYTLLDTTNVTRFFAFTMPEVNVTETTFSESDILSRFDIRHLPYIQDTCFIDGRIYVSSGMGEPSVPGMITVIDAGFQAIVAQVNFNDSVISVVRQSEPELIDYYNGKLIIGMNGTSRMYLLSF